MKYRSMNVEKQHGSTYITGSSGLIWIGTSAPCVLLTIELI